MSSRRPLLLTLLLVVILAAVLFGVFEPTEPPPAPVTLAAPTDEADRQEASSAGLLARSPDPQFLTAARELLGSSRGLSQCGPYPLWTDVEDQTLLQACDAIGTMVEPMIEDRLRLVGRGQPAEAIILFARRQDFRAFSRQAGVPVGYAGFALGSKGLAIFHADDIEPEMFYNTLAHELTHLVLRRSLGAKVAPWLSEGLATEIGLSAHQHRLSADDRFSRPRTQRLRKAHLAGQIGSLERLLGLTREEFDRETVAHDYEQSHLLVSLLLDSDKYGPPFREYLDTLSRSPDTAPETLLTHLDASWIDLTEAFEAGLRSRLTAARAVGE